MTELEKRVDELENQVIRIHAALMMINATLATLASQLQARSIPHS